MLTSIRALDQKHDLIVVSQGGVRNGQDAWQRIKSGADIVQIYTPIVVEGPRVVGEMLNQMQEEMRKEGIKDIN